MNMSQHKEQFNKRWNITCMDSPEKTFSKFKQRILNIFESIKLEHEDNVMSGRYHYIEGIDAIVTKESILNFCQYYGISYNENEKDIIIYRLKNENNNKEFYRLVDMILNVLVFVKGCIPTDKETKKYLIKKVKEAVDMSDMDVAIKVKNPQGPIILYPKGERLLDEELVNKVLSFLDDKSNKHFEESLKFYQSKNPVKSAESLRRSLEEFLRYKLKNQKGLAKNIETLQQQLKIGNDSKTKKAEVRNIIFQTFKYLDTYFNENSKHKDGVIKEPENEFLIYQTSLLMRYINSFDFKNLGNSLDSSNRGNNGTGGHASTYGNEGAGGKDRADRNGLNRRNNSTGENDSIHRNNRADGDDKILENSNQTRL